MATLITGAGVIGTAFARRAARRGEPLVFLDSQPRDDFLRLRLGDIPAVGLRADIRDLPELLGWEPQRTLEAALRDYVEELQPIGTDRLERPQS